MATLINLKHVYSAYPVTLDSGGRGCQRLLGPPQPQPALAPTDVRLLAFGLPLDCLDNYDFQGCKSSI